MSRIAYEIRVEGDLPPSLLEDFNSVTVVDDPAGAIMRADLTDEAELHGILDALRRGGLILIDVRREQESEPSESPPTAPSRSRTTTTPAWSTTPPT